ncbi:MAG: hypothetical protein ACRDYC_05365 [Acidimicrobiales bacterium]
MSVSEHAPQAGGRWSSTLSVNEMVAIRQAGFEPCGLVMGSSVYQLGYNYGPGAYYQGSIGMGMGGMGMGGMGMGMGMGGGGYVGRFPGWVRYYQPSGGAAWPGAGPMLGGGAWMGTTMMAWAVNWERVVFEDGIEHASSLALDRALAECASLGGHGIVGTRLNFRYLEGMGPTLEFTALGTAVRRRGAAPLSRPFSSHLSGQELMKLMRAGMVPMALVVGAGSVATTLRGGYMGWGPTEIGPFGEATEQAWRIATERMTGRAGGAWAVLGTTASSSTGGEGEERVVTTVLTGTAVRRFDAGRWPDPPLPIMRLSKP